MTMTQSQKILDILYNSTYIQNMNKGYVESTVEQGMAYPKDSVYNNPNTLHTDMTKSQSNYMNPKQAKVI